MSKTLKKTVAGGFLFLAILSLSSFESFNFLTGGQPAAVWEFVNFETAHVHPIDLTPDGNTLLAVNTANYSLEVFDVSASGISHKISIPVGMDPVTVRVRSNTEAWVVNAISDDISIVDLTNFVVTKSIKVANEPADVVFAGNPLKAFVSSSEPSLISVFDLSNLNAAPTVVTVIGEELRALAASPDGTTVYGAFFESGNQTTLVQGDIGPELDDVIGGSEIASGPYGNVVVPPNDGAGFNPPLGPEGLPPFIRSMIVRKNSAGQWMDDNNGNWTSVITGGNGVRVAGWDLPDRDVVILNAAALTVSYQHHLGNILMAMDVNPQSGKVTVVGTDATNEIRFEPNLNGKFLRVNMSSFMVGQSTQVKDLNGHLNYQTSSVAQSEREKSIGDPRGIAWRASGNKGYITGMGSNNVIIVDANGDRTVTQPIEVGEGPTGIVIDESSDRAFIINKFDASISILDLNTDQEVARVPFFDPTPEAIQIGRKHLYDTHAGSGTGHIACASCHVDGKQDRLAWDLGVPGGSMQPFPENAILGSPKGAEVPTEPGFHPMKGPKTTQTLQDIILQEQLLHWRGDRESLHDFAIAFVDLQGADAEPSSAEMQEFADFLSTIHYPPSPHRNLDNSLSTTVSVPGPGGTTSFVGDAVAGGTFFGTALSGSGDPCVSCHLGNTGRSRVRLSFEDGRIAGGFRGELDKMGLFYNSVDGSTAGFGFLNDGSMDSAFPFHFATQNGDFLAFMMSFEGSELGISPFAVSQPSQDSHAAVGQHTTVHGAYETGQDAFLNQLKGIVDQSDRVGMIVSGTLNGELRNFYYEGNDSYQSDKSSETYTHAQLTQAATTAGPLSWLVVHDAVKVRASVDRNNNGVFDRDELLSACFEATPNPAVPAPAVVNFDALPSVIPPGINVSYSWNFGDGNNGTGIRPTHTYANAGTYLAVLTVTDVNDVNNTSTFQQSIQVYASADDYPRLDADRDNDGIHNETEKAEELNLLETNPGAGSIKINWNGEIFISIVGGSGGGGSRTHGGTGATVEGTFTVSAGDVIRYVVGEGSQSGVTSAGGAGSTGVFINNDLIMVAGGGGGGDNSSGAIGLGATDGEDGLSGTGNTPGAGGVTGNGGGASGLSGAAGGGGGTISAGGDPPAGTATGGGAADMNPADGLSIAAGGAAGSSGSAGGAGFTGGGGSGSAYSGGGGGYSGGGAAGGSGSAGGGGSFLNTTVTSFISGRIVAGENGATFGGAGQIGADGSINIRSFLHQKESMGTGAYTVDYSGELTIVARGAGGGGGSSTQGGEGASVEGLFWVEPGDVVRYVVGQGSSAGTTSAGGGGSTGVFINNDLVLVAGGGAGGNNSGGGGGFGANRTELGRSGSGASGGAGGIDGDGGMAGTGLSNTGEAGAGGGITTSGENALVGAATGGAAADLNPADGVTMAAGGTAGTDGSAGGSGFTGGGGAGGTYSGGGGGYSGGGSAGDSGAAGGGGSYLNEDAASYISGTITAGAHGASSGGAGQNGQDGSVILFNFLIDTDCDGVPDIYDLDSDNDGLWDVSEAGGTDENLDAFIDDLAMQGSITDPINSDADDLPDFQDLESENAANDGTGPYDILYSGCVDFDTNGDGQITSLDTGGGVDDEEDGLDDLIDGDLINRGSGIALTLSIKVNLQGAYDGNTGLMFDHLRSNGLLPTNQSTTKGPIHVRTSVFATTGQDAIVDWVEVILLDTDMEQVSQTVALVQKDGDIVSLNGSSAVPFPNVPADNYYIQIRHRNHLAIMTRSPVGF